MTWLKQNIFKRLKGTWGVRFSGIVGADGKYRRLSSNSSASKKKMRLLCVSLHPSLFKYVPKCQVKPHQLMATRSWCFGCVLRCSDASGISKVRTAATTRCKQRWLGLFVWKKIKSVTPAANWLKLVELLPARVAGTWWVRMMMAGTSYGLV